MKKNSVFKINCYFCIGEMAEWSNATVLKTAVPQGTGGSNPSFSAGPKRKIAQKASIPYYCSVLRDFSFSHFSRESLKSLKISIYSYPFCYPSKSG